MGKRKRKAPHKHKGLGRTIHSSANRKRRFKPAIRVFARYIRGQIEQPGFAYAIFHGTEDTVV